MSPIYVPGKVTLRQTWQPMDPDAAAYITAVETADGLPLEEKVKIAIDNFVLGCKADGIWSAIKASCILAGARTTNGALVPLVGTEPTPYNFDLVGDTDYDRKTGLKGDGTTKYLDSKRSATADSIDNRHFSAYKTATGGVNKVIMGYYSASPTFFGYLIAGSSGWRWSCNSATQTAITGPSVSTGFAGVSKVVAGTVDARFNGINYTASIANASLQDLNAFVFARNNSGTEDIASDCRIAFYSIGESLNLALLDARVTDLINAFKAAIP